MIRQTLAWTLFAVSLWVSGSSQVLQREPIKVLTPKILKTESIRCACAGANCDAVYWFHATSNYSSIRFLTKCNNADRKFYGTGVDTKRFLCKRESSSFVLRIVNVTENDAGIYSCVLTERSINQIWKPGILLLPGVILPTLPPPTKPAPPVKLDCGCPKKASPAPDGCGSLILWPLVGLLTTLGLVFICTLYYFSRLPKKCRHHFVKRRR